MNKFMKKLMKKDGFTLVELIVVIAILAILAGVAVPAYSGYIKSANEAADNQKIEALNTAIAAAVSMEGKDVADANNYFTITFDTDSTELNVATKEVADTDVDSRIWTSFTQFYGTDCKIDLDYYTTTDAVNAVVEGVTVSASDAE